MSKSFVRTKIFSVLWRRQQGKCFYCDRNLKRAAYNKKTTKNGCTRDHFFPFSKGNSALGNIVISCFSCNNLKNDNPPTYSDCVRFVEVWSNLEHPDKRVKLPEELWKDFIQELIFIRNFSRFFGLPTNNEYFCFS